MSQEKISHLKWYNHLYRRINTCVIQAHENKLHLKATKISIVAFVVWYFPWFNSERGELENPSCLPFEYWLRDFVGSYPHCDKRGDLLEDLPSHYHYAGNHPFYGLGNMQLKWNEYNRGKEIILIPLFAALILLYKDDVKSLTQWIIKIFERGKEHLIILHHTLLGDIDAVALDHD